LIELGREILDAGTHGRWQIGLLDQIEIAARFVKRANAVIENRQFQLHAWQAWDIDQHALKSADRAFEVTDFDREKRVFKGSIEIVWIVDQDLKQV